MEHLLVEKAVFLTNASSYTMKATGLLASLFILHYLAPSEFGLWKVALAIASVAGSWFMAIHPAVTAEMIRSEVDKQSQERGFILWKGYWRLTLILSVMMAIISVGFGNIVSTWFGLADARLFYFAIVLLFLWVMKLHAQIWSKVLYQFRPMLWAQMIEGVSYIIFLIIFVHTQRLGVLGLGFANILSVALGLVCSGALIIKGWRRCPKTSAREDLIEVLKLMRQHGKWAFIVKLLKDNIDAFRIWFIQLLVGPYGVGLYSFAQSILVQCLTIVHIETAFVATITRYVQAREKFVHVIGQAARLSTLAYGAVFLVACVTVPFIVPHVFPAYTAGVPVFLTIAPYILINGIYTILSNVFHILRWQKKLSLLYIGRVFLFLLMILLLGWKRPLVTASVELIVGTLFLVIAMIVVLRKEYKLEGMVRALLLPTVEDVVVLKERTRRMWQFVTQCLRNNWFVFVKRDK